MRTNGTWMRRGATIVIDLDSPAALKPSLERELESGQPTLRQGSRGSAVSDLQARLVALRFSPGPIDGMFGPLTGSAVRAFQRSRQLQVDGIVGPQTFAALESQRAPGSTPPKPAPPPTAFDVVTVRGITVARSIAAQVESLLAAAADDGIALSGSGFRTREQQIALRRQNCGTTNHDIFEKSPSQCKIMTAIPGTSRHEQGLAIDFRYNGSKMQNNDPGFQWLSANALSIAGLRNLKGEAWHWSVDGK